MEEMTFLIIHMGNLLGGIGAAIFAATVFDFFKKKRTFKKFEESIKLNIYKDMINASSTPRKKKKKKPNKKISGQVGSTSVNEKVTITDRLDTSLPNSIPKENLIDYLTLLGHLYEINSLISYKQKKEGEGIGLEDFEKLLRLRYAFLYMCDKYLSPSERKDILEGLYIHKSEIDQAKYMVGILNKAIAGTDILDSEMANINTDIPTNNQINR